VPFKADGQDGWLVVKKARGTQKAVKPVMIALSTKQRGKRRRKTHSNQKNSKRGEKMREGDQAEIGE